MGSLISSLQFLSYKVDNMSLQVANTTHVLLKNYSSEAEWVFAVGIRRPVYIVSEKIYIGGVNIKMYLGDQTNPDVHLQAGIAGAFKIMENGIPPDIENKLAKNQIPALLSPYLRAAVTGTLASAGFGSVLLPLFNFNVLAEEQLKDVEIEYINENENSQESENRRG